MKISIQIPVDTRRHDRELDTQELCDLLINFFLLETEVSQTVLFAVQLIFDDKVG